MSEDQDDRDGVAVVGAGAIGIALAAAMARTGRAITVCGGHPLEQLRITEPGGARSDGAGSDGAGSGAVESWPVTWAQDPADVTPRRTVLLAVKAHQTASAGRWLSALTGAGTTVLVAQNGVEHRARVAPFVDPAAAVAPAVVYLNVERTEPGAVILRRVGDRDLALPDDPASRALAALLVDGGMRVGIEPDLTTVAWAKLLTNITANPLTALTGRRAEVIREPAVAAIARRLMVEAVQVARAEGAALTEADADAALRWLQDVPPGATTSMLQDRLAGRPLEYDALTGAVVRAADRHGIEVPANRFVLALLGAVRPAA